MQFGSLIHLVQYPYPSEVKLKMDSKLATTYDEFEPLCNWQREEGRDTLVLHLPGTNYISYVIIMRAHVFLKGVNSVDLFRKQTILIKTNSIVLCFGRHFKNSKSNS